MKIEKKLEKKIVKPNIWKDMLAIVVIVISFSTIASATGEEYKFPDNAPFQNTIKQAIIDGKISSNDIEGSPEYNTEILEKTATRIKLRSTTRITFKNAKGAGYGNNVWPKFEIGPAKSNIKAKDYNQQIRDSILADINNIKDNTERTKKLEEFNKYNFENGPRTYEFSEIYEITYPEGYGTFSATANSINNYDILMGFTKNIYWQYRKEANLYILGIHIAWAKVDTELNAVLGLRLPTTVGLSTPDLMIRGKSYNLKTNINGQDWGASKYSAVNVPSENGNEFVARGQATLVAQGWVIAVGNLGPYSLNKAVDYGKSFKTPFGPNEEFPIPDLLLSPDQTGIKIDSWALWAGMGLKIDPDLGSDKITANWNAAGDAKGNGNVEYKIPLTYYNFGSVNAGDYNTMADYATIKLSDYKYYFTVCRLNLAANLQGGISIVDLGIETPYIDLYTYDCGGLTGDYNLGVHEGTTANSVSKEILIKGITVATPNGGEGWKRGTIHTVTWTYSNSGTNVKIELLKGGSKVRTISSSTPNDGSYSWPIPPTQTLANDYKIRITSKSNSAYKDTSDNNFIITT